MTHSTSKRSTALSASLGLDKHSSTSNYLNVPPHASGEQVDFSLYVVNTVHNKQDGLLITILPLIARTTLPLPQFVPLDISFRNVTSDSPPLKFQHHCESLRRVDSGRKLKQGRNQRDANSKRQSAGACVHNGFRLHPAQSRRRTHRRLFFAPRCRKTERCV